MIDIENHFAPYRPAKIANTTIEMLFLGVFMNERH